MATPEINVQIDSFLEKKGLLQTEGASINDTLSSSLDTFLTSRGYQIPGVLERPKVSPPPTEEQKQFVSDMFSRTKPHPAVIEVPTETPGPYPKIEMADFQSRPAFWNQVKDLAVAWANGKIDEKDLIGREFFKGLTLGNVDPYDIVEKISGKPGFKAMAEAATTERVRQAVGYEPSEAKTAISGASRMSGSLLPYAGILKGAGVAAKVLPKIPMLRAAARGVVSGIISGMAEKPEEEGLANRLKQVPPNVLFFTAFETLGLTAEQVLKIYQWNKQFKGYKPGARISPISKEVVGEAREFTAQDMRDIFRKMQANQAGTGGAWSRLTPEEQDVVNTITGTQGWKNAVKSGFIKEGEVETLYGLKVSPE
jgi:hypothetical protein